jgi:exopolysaccharide biosynthesis protein
MKQEKTRGLLRGFGRALSLLAVTLLCLALSLLGIVWVFEKGPSPTLTAAFCSSVRETSAIRWMSRIFLSDEELGAYIQERTAEQETEQVNTSLIRVAAREAAAAETQEELEPELVDISYGNCRGKLLVVHDPKRVVLGYAGNFVSGTGLQLTDMVERCGGVAGINAGGFVDEEGTGSGWPPSGITLSRGTVFQAEEGGSIAGFDQNDHMWNGYLDLEDCLTFGIRDTVSFGPALVMDGVKADPEDLETGIGARTLIGQRRDGVVVLVAIDGRQGYSIGVTFPDCVDLMADKFGCVNASNMDGGNSTSMIYRGEPVNRSANKAAGTRDMPDAWLVSPLPEDYVRPEGVPDSVSIPENILGAGKEYVAACDDETLERMYTFAWVFAKAYYGYFGTKWYEKHYPDLAQYVAPECELRERMDLALMDRDWVNTWATDVNALTLDGAYSNGDGTFDILVTMDVYEKSAYWNYDASGLQLRITVIEAPEARVGFLAVATY